MRPAAVVIVPPLCEHASGMTERAEHGLIQHLVAQPTVERLHERILDQLAGLNVVLGDARVLLPAQHRRRRELGAIVADHKTRLATPSYDDM